MKNQALVTFCGESCYCDYKPKGCNHIRKRPPNQNQNIFSPQIIHVVVPYHVDAYYEDKTNTKFQKIKKTW